MDPTFNTKDQKVIVKFLHLMKNDVTEIRKQLAIACGPDAADYKIVKNWVCVLDGGNDDNEEDVPTRGPNGIQKTVLPPSPTDPAMVQRVEYLITRDKRINQDRISEMSCISKTLVQSTITNILGLKRVCERWVPRLWTPEQREYRIEVSKELYNRYEDEGDNFLNRIIVGDETFVHYYTPDKLNLPTNPHRRLSKGIAEERFRPLNEPDTVNFIFFYDCEGILLFHMVQEGLSVSANYYSEFLKTELTNALKRKRKLTPKDVCLLHDNTPVHNSLETQKALKEIGMEVLPHPPASPDMEPHEYFLFTHLLNAMKKTPFQSPLTINTTIQHHLTGLPESHFANSIRKLAGRWEHSIESRGLYIL